MSGLYVHVPFCERACPYCDFDFEVGRRPGLDTRIEAWLAGLEAEWGRREQELREGLEAAPFDTLYLGGGTPSALGAVGLGRVLDWLGARVGAAAEAMLETTVELNPEHVGPALLEVLVARGVDRVSLGVQSLEALGLRELGRGHEAREALACVIDSVAAGLRVSADLIVGWRGQSAAGLEAEIDALVGAGVEHLSVYGLSIEPETPWLKLVRRGLRVLPDEDGQADLLEVAEARLGALGFAHYEVASYARPGAEAIHNSKYWRWRDVVGLGPSAASVHHRGQRVGEASVVRRSNPRGLEAWLGGERPTHECLEGDQAAGEGLWLGLRRLDGVEVEVYLARFCRDRPWLEVRVARQIALGNLEWRQRDGTELLRVAPGRWLFHDTIAQAVL